MSLNAPNQKLQHFINQTVELRTMLQFRERVEEFLSKDSETSRLLYDKAASLVNIEQSEANIAKREAVLDALNMHIMQVCFDDADNDTLQIMYISRLIPQFFQQPSNQSRFNQFRELHINGQNLTVIPLAINSLQNIVVLNLSGNKIQKLPDIFPSLSKLKLINLQNNPLAAEALASMQKYCSSNNITLQANGVNSQSEKIKFRNK